MVCHDTELASHPVSSILLFVALFKFLVICAARYGTWSVMIRLELASHPIPTDLRWILFATLSPPYSQFLWWTLQLTSSSGCSPALRRGFSVNLLTSFYDDFWTSSTFSAYFSFDTRLRTRTRAQNRTLLSWESPSQWLWQAFSELLRKILKMKSPFLPMLSHQHLKVPMDSESVSQENV